ncbi:hypothetical protein SAMN05660816_06672 [Niastella yeongjuensis]|nr:hypothetical protein SAMN05660816_06672 [Niastella yeongjuensis]
MFVVNKSTIEPGDGRAEGNVNKEIYEIYKRLPWGIAQLTIFTYPNNPKHPEIFQFRFSLSHQSQPSRNFQFRYFPIPENYAHDPVSTEPRCYH